MTIDDRRINDLLTTSTADVPARHLVPPTAAIRRAARRRRRLAVAASAFAASGVLLGVGAAIGPLTHRPTPPVPGASAPPASLAGDELAWLSAMVARDGWHVTVFVGPGAHPCADLVQPSISLVRQNTTDVVIGVRGRIVSAGDCNVSNRAVPLTVTLPGLGERAVRDVTGQAHPTYYAAELPDLTRSTEWQPAQTTWSGTSNGWSQAYNGPGGAEIDLEAQPSASYHPGATVSTVTLGPHQVHIVRFGDTSWAAWWRVKDVTYTLKLLPPEGASYPVTTFRQQLDKLSWS